jgi:hypothetical protein
MIQWWVHRCSRCGKVYARTLAPKPIRLGIGSRRCKKCGTAFSDGSKEWPQLSSAERWSFFITNEALVFLLPAVALGGAAYTYGDNLLDGVRDAVVVGGICLFPYLPVWVMKSTQIVRSRRRHALAIQERGRIV